MSKHQTISTVRAELLATLADLRCRNNPMDPSRAKVIAQIGSVLVATARVENEFLEITGGTSSTFFLENDDDDDDEGAPDLPRLSSPMPGVTRHRLR